MKVFLIVYFAIGLLWNFIPNIVALIVDHRFFDSTVRSTTEKVIDVIASIIIAPLWPFHVVTGVLKAIKISNGDRDFTDGELESFDEGCRLGGELRKKVKGAFKRSEL